MRKSTHPKWKDWSVLISGWISAAVKHSEIIGYRINSAPTLKNIPVKDPDRSLGSMPYISCALVGWEPGWDGVNSGQPNYNDREYTALGGDKILESSVTIKEQLMFTLEIFTQKYDEAIEISDIIHKYFGPAKTLSFAWNNSTYDVDIKLDDYNINVVEGSKTGKVEFFHSSLMLTIYAIADSLDDDTINKAINSVITDVTAEINDEESTITKTIT